MNSAENLVEDYYRIVRNCLTTTDIRMDNNENNEFDLFAINNRINECFHIEINVSFKISRLDQLSDRIERKFLGLDRKGMNPKFGDIERTYNRYGISSHSSRFYRVWVCWSVRGRDNRFHIPLFIRSRHLSSPMFVTVISLRDYIFPRLCGAVGTCNYNNETSRMISLFNQRNR